MKKIYKIFILVLTTATLVACNKKEENAFDKIVDPEFKSYLLAVYDTDVDFNLSNEEIKAVTVIATGGHQIRSFGGIEIFTNLHEVDLLNIKVKTIDLSKNRGLRRVKYYDSPDIETIYISSYLKDKIILSPDNSPAYAYK